MPHRTKTVHVDFEQNRALYRQRETKDLETEFSYSVEGDERDALDGIRLDPNLATSSVCDNNDENVETVDGKETFNDGVYQGEILKQIHKDP